ncbi:hypothetical protein HWI79_2786 [Cryptosporidium felis]|nr:hypothetical protein HWI79_2786 [Cryptosporidium felis]
MGMSKGEFLRIRMQSALGQVPPEFIIPYISLKSWEESLLERNLTLAGKLSSLFSTADNFVSTIPSDLYKRYRTPFSVTSEPLNVITMCFGTLSNFSNLFESSILSEENILCSTNQFNIQYEIKVSLK